MRLDRLSALLGLPRTGCCRSPRASTTTTSRPNGGAPPRPALVPVILDAEVPNLAAQVDLHRTEQAG
jgi:hypothetical protein